eukprot:812608-Pelagomonas_calceolata.AAC.2
MLSVAHAERRPHSIGQGPLAHRGKNEGEKAGNWSGDCVYAHAPTQILGGVYIDDRMGWACAQQTCARAHWPPHSGQFARPHAHARRRMTFS